MHNYLNILLIIITLFVASCTKNTTETYQVDYENQFDGNIDYKYKHLYNSLYVNIALERDLKEDALKTFVDNIDILTDIKLYEKISKISLELYNYKNSEIIAKKWLAINPDSYSAHQFAIKSSLESSNIYLANEYFESYIKKIKTVNYT